MLKGINAQLHLNGWLNFNTLRINMSITKQQVTDVLKRLEDNQIIKAVNQNILVKHPCDVGETFNNLVALSTCQPVKTTYDIIAKNIEKGKTTKLVYKDSKDTIDINIVSVHNNLNYCRLYSTFGGPPYSLEYLLQEFPYVANDTPYDATLFNDLIALLRDFDPEKHTLFCEDDNEEVTSIVAICVDKRYSLKLKTPYRLFTLEEVLNRCYKGMPLIYNGNNVTFDSLTRDRFSTEYSIVLKDVNVYITFPLAISFKNIKFANGTPFGVKVD